MKTISCIPLFDPREALSRSRLSSPRTRAGELPFQPRDALKGLAGLTVNFAASHAAYRIDERR